MKKLLNCGVILADIIFAIVCFNQNEIFMGVLSILCAVFGIIDACFKPTSECNNYEEEYEEYDEY